MDAILTVALTCASLLMHEPVPQSVDVQVVRMSMEALQPFCAYTEAPKCYALFQPTGAASGLIIDATGDFGEMAHEACHVIQSARPGYVYDPKRDEAECEEVQRSVKRCPQR